MDTEMEELSRELLLVVMAGLPTALGEVATEMVEKDRRFYTAINRPIPDTPLDSPAYYDVGHHPTLLDWDLAKFPNVVAVCYDHRSQREPLDQVEVIGNTAYVEAFAAHRDESTINRIAWRYAKALHRVVSGNPTLNGLVRPIGFAPDLMISNSAARRVSDLSDEVIYTQGCRLEFVFEVAEPTDTWWSQ